jgi:predicted TIM-barrel fold metal-dependent hydrolase
MTLIVDAQLHPWRDVLPGRQAHRPGTFDTPEMLAAMRQAGVAGAVLIPPRWEPTGNLVAIESAKEHPDRFTVFGLLNSLDGLADRLAGWHLEGMRGVWLHCPHDPVTTWVDSGAIEALWVEAEKTGFPVMVLAPGRRLDLIGDAARRHPGVPITLCHLALGKGQSQAEIAEQVDRLVGLAELPNLCVKVSSLPAFSHEKFPFYDMFDPTRRVIDAFGPERCFFGTNITRQPCTYEQAIEMMWMIIDGLDDREQELVMGGALTRWLGWMPAPLSPEVRNVGR